MADGMPAGGYPMRMAVYTLQVGEWVRIAEQYYFLETNGPVTSTRHLLWLQLVERANRGEIVFRGAVTGATKPEPIHPGMLSGAVPDFAADSLRAGETVFYCITVVEAEAADLTVKRSAGQAWTTSQVQIWFVARIAEFANSPRHPSEKDDVAAAALRFPGVSRDTIRSLRGQFVAADRRKQGRAKSAKPPQ